MILWSGSHIRRVSELCISFEGELVAARWKIERVSEEVEWLAELCGIECGGLDLQVRGEGWVVKDLLEAEACVVGDVLLHCGHAVVVQYRVGWFV
jgi:hypothetical protein